MSRDLIYKDDALDLIFNWKAKEPWDKFDQQVAFEIIHAMPSAEPEQPTEIQEILKYLDEELYPIVAPDNWIIYSELHDMISELSAQPEQINPCTICQEFDCYGCKFRRTT